MNMSIQPASPFRFDEALENLSFCFGQILATKEELTEANPICKDLFERIRDIYSHLTQNKRNEEIIQFNKTIKMITKTLDKQHPLVAKTIRQFTLHLDNFSLTNENAFLNSQPVSSANPLPSYAADIIMLPSTTPSDETALLREVHFFFLQGLDVLIAYLEKEGGLNSHDPLTPKQLEPIQKLVSTLVQALTVKEDESSIGLLSAVLDLDQSTSLQILKERTENIKLLIAFYENTFPSFGYQENPLASSSIPLPKKSNCIEEHTPLFAFDREAAKRCLDMIDSVLNKFPVSKEWSNLLQEHRQDIYQDLNKLLREGAQSDQPAFLRLLEFYKQNPFFSAVVCRVYSKIMRRLFKIFEEMNNVKILSQNPTSLSKKRTYSLAILGFNCEAELTKIDELRRTYQLTFKQTCEEILVNIRPQLQENPSSPELKYAYVAAWRQLIDFCPRLYTEALAKEYCRDLHLDFAKVEAEFWTMRERNFEL